MKVKIKTDRITTHQSCVKYNKKVQKFYRTDKYYKHQKTIYEALDEIEYKDEFLFNNEKPLEFDIKLFFRLPKGESEDYYKDNHFTPCMKHIDCDNVAKLINDAISNYYGFDDSLICSLRVRKYWYYDETFTNDYIILDLNELSVL